MKQSSYLRPRGGGSFTWQRGRSRLAPPIAQGRPPEDAVAPAQVRRREKTAHVAIRKDTTRSNGGGGPLPGPSASRVRGPERGAHGAFHTVAQNGGRAVPPHWIIPAPPEPGAEPLRDGEIRGNEPASPATPDGNRNALGGNRSRRAPRRSCPSARRSVVSSGARSLSEKSCRPATVGRQATHSEPAPRGPRWQE